MTASDLTVLAFLAATLVLAPRTLRTLAIFLGVTIAVGVASFLAGNTELFITAGAVLAAALLASFMVGIRAWKIDLLCKHYRSETELHPVSAEQCEFRAQYAELLG